jgi:predicted kinase
MGMIKLLSLLKEIKDKPKAIFLSGPAGSGKTFISKKVIPLDKFQIINIDDTYEELLKSSGMGMNQKNFSPEELSQSAKLMGSAQKITREKYIKALEGLNNVIIDGTGGASNPLLKKKQELENLGYDTFMLMIWTSPTTSLSRNAERERSLMPSIVLRTWRDINKNIDLYKQAFGNNMVIINNDPEGLETKFDVEDIKKKYFTKQMGKPKTPAEQEKSEKETEQLNKDIEQFIKEKPQFNTLSDAQSKINKFINS